MAVLSLNSLRRMPQGLIFALLFLLSGLHAYAQAPRTVVVTELIVNGPPGALLSVDGSALGRLPLSDNLILGAGGHRFQLERGNQKAQSDVLTLPANRQAELNLTLAGRNLVAVLSITPAILLLLEPDDLAGGLRARLTEAIAATARREHTVLLGRDQQPSVLRWQPAITRCLKRGDCHEPISPEGEVAYVLQVWVTSEPAGSGTYHIQAELLDLRTRDIGASAQASCVSCDADKVSAQLAELCRQVLTEATSRPRGTLSVTTSPNDARVLVDGRWLGQSPYQQETFVGTHSVKVQRDGYMTREQSVELMPGQTALVQLPLQHNRVSQSARPRWRLITGGILVGSGLLAAGFSASALAANGQCQDRASDFATCTPFYNTLKVGAGLLGSGTAALIAGTVLLALPARPTERTVHPSAASEK